MLAHDRVKHFLSPVPERRMPDIVYQSQRFHQINVQPKLSGHRAGNLRNFQGVSQAIAKMVGVTADKNLCLGFQPAKGPRMNYAVAVPLEVVAVTMLRFRVATPARLFHPHGVVGQHGQRIALLISDWHVANNKSEIFNLNFLLQLQPYLASRESGYSSELLHRES